MAKILVTADAIADAIETLSKSKYLGLDTETYTHTETKRLFAIQIADDQDEYYFNFHDYADGTYRLDRSFAKPFLTRLTERRDPIWFIHNAKFDYNKMYIEGLQIEGEVHCTQMGARFEYNQHVRYSLDACLKRIGMSKDDRVAAYIKEHKLYTDGEPRYDMVPFEIMFEYGCHDTRGCFELGVRQLVVLRGQEYYLNDRRLQKVLARMERRGITVDQEYAQGGLEYEQQQQQEAAENLSELAGVPFVSGPKWLRNFFDTNGVKYAVNPKTNNPIFDKTALAAINHPAAALIRKYRRHEKYAGTYYAHYVKSDTCHAFIKPYGTDTGRFSYEEPNLQNVPKEEELDESVPYQVRGCFRPREDYCLVAIDYDQQEFRLFLDYSGEKDVINLIMREGLDVHQATADMVGITRKQAKNLNFGLLYGMGAAKLAASLGVDEYQANQIIAQYFASMPRVRALIRAIIKKAETQKVVKTWCGRPLYFPNKDFAYAAPNHLIQGGCADIVRFAMPRIDDLFEKTNARSGMLLQVHDELVLEIHKNELDLIEPVRRIMQDVYKPFNGMYLTCGVEHSWKSWGKRDMVEGLPVL